VSRHDWRAITGWVAVAAMLSACSAADEDGDTERSELTETQNDTPSAAQPSVGAVPTAPPVPMDDSPSGVAPRPLSNLPTVPISSVEDVDGVWVFSSDEDCCNQAPLVGNAEIVGGCLGVAGELVVWNGDDLDFARALAGRVMAGETPGLTIGGSLYAVMEEVTQRCGNAERAFYGRVESK